MTGADYAFGSFCFDPKRGSLRLDGAPVVVGTRAMQLLEALLERGGDLVTKEELYTRLWPSVIVEEGNLSTQVWSLRKALGDSERPHRWILSVPGRGYRFSGAATRVPAGVGLAPAPPAAFEEPRELHNLPRRAITLIGREAELDALPDLLRERRVVTLAGMGGLGKTELALQVGARVLEAFPDGVWFVALDRLTPGDQIAEATARAIGAPLPGAGAAEDLLIHFLRRKRLLLILDNCEHVIEAAARLADAVVERCGEVSILATSREPLRVAAEHVVRLAPLACPPPEAEPTAVAIGAYSAVQLFVRRAEAALGGFALTDETAPLAAQICRRLDGVALAIELAAARLRLFALPDLLAGLDDRFRILSGGSRAALPRQRTLEAAIAWSYDLLTEPEKLVFRRLSVFGGGFDFASAEAVAADDSDALETMSSLVEKSLVTSSPDTPGRFRLLDSTKAYGLARLDAAEATACRRRLAERMADLFARAEAERNTMATEPWLARYARDVENLRAALGWAFGPDGDAALGVGIIAHGCEAFTELSLLRERQHWLDLASAHLGTATPAAIRGRVLVMALAPVFGRRENLAPALEAAAALREAGDTLFLGWALRAAAMALAKPGDVGDAELHLRDAETRLRPLGVTRPLLGIVTIWATVRKFAGDLAGARQYFEQSLAMGRAIGSLRSTMVTSVNLAELDYAEGLVEAAIARGRETCRTCRRSGLPAHLAAASTNLAAYLLSRGDLEEGRACARAAVELLREHEPAPWLATCLEHLALAAALEGGLTRAAGLAGFCDERRRARRRPREFTEATGWADLTRRLEAGLAADERDRLTAQGAIWTDDWAVHVALADEAGAVS